MMQTRLHNLGVGQTWRPRRVAAFTLIELLVAVGLMALMLSMIATIFFRTTAAFSLARATVEIHQNARAVLDAVGRDVTASEFCSYGATQGFFVMDREAVTIGTDTLYLPRVTFTTLAPQPGAKYAAPEAIQQLALVRYSLEWTGEQVKLAEDPEQEVPTFRIVKRVRFPRTDNPNLNMDEFDAADLVWEYDPGDAQWARYARPEPISFTVLSMGLRAYYNGETIFVEQGRAESGGSTTLTDSDKTWTGQHTAEGRSVRIITGSGAGQSDDLVADSGSTLQVSSSWPTANPDSTSQYRIEEDFAGPAWAELPGTNGALIGFADRPPALLEIRIRITDEKAVRTHTFAERYYLPASER